MTFGDDAIAVARRVSCERTGEILIDGQPTSDPIPEIERRVLLESAPWPSLHPGVRDDIYLAAVKSAVRFAARPLQMTEAGNLATLAKDTTAPPAGDVVRSYWNVAWTGIVPAARVVAAMLDASDGPSMATLRLDPQRNLSPDALTVVVETSGAKAALRRWEDGARRLEPYLRPSVPRFTKRWRRGVAVVEEPAGTGAFLTRAAVAVHRGVLSVPGGDEARRGGAIRASLREDRLLQEDPS